MLRGFAGFNLSPPDASLAARFYRSGAGLISCYLSHFRIYQSRRIRLILWFKWSLDVYLAMFSNPDPVAAK